MASPSAADLKGWQLEDVPPPTLLADEMTEGKSEWHISMAPNITA